MLNDKPSYSNVNRSTASLNDSGEEHNKQFLVYRDFQDLVQYWRSFVNLTINGFEELL